MVIILFSNPQTGQMQFITEGCDQGQGVMVMEQACKQIRGQALVNGTPIPQAPGLNGGPVPSPGVPGVPGVATPPEPRRSNIREIIRPKSESGEEE